MEINLIFDEESLLAALFSTWRSVRKLPDDVKLSIACMLMENEHADTMGEFNIYKIDNAMTVLFPMLDAHLDPEQIEEYDAADKEGAEQDEGYLYGPRVREYLEMMGEADLANKRLE